MKKHYITVHTNACVWWAIYIAYIKSPKCMHFGDLCRETVAEPEGQGRRGDFLALIEKDMAPLG